MQNTIKTAMGEIVAAQRALDSVHHHAGNPAIQTAHARLDAAFSLMVRSNRETTYHLKAYAGFFGPELARLENARVIAQEIADRERIPVSVWASTNTEVLRIHPRNLEN